MTALDNLNATEATASFQHQVSLAGKMIYLAHPIDVKNISQRQSEQMYQLTKALRQAGAVVFDPAGAFHVGHLAKPNPSISRINTHALRTADAVVACYPETPGVGTAMEIQLADSLGIPLLILTDVGDRSWSLAGLENALLIPNLLNSEWEGWLAEEIAEYAEVRGSVVERQPRALWVQAQRPEHVPVRKHPDDAGFDLFVSEETAIPAGETRDVPCGCAIQLPEGVWGLVMGRSSTRRKHSLIVHSNVIDTGYRGPLFVSVDNVGKDEFTATPGMRLGQLVPLPNVAADLVAVETVALQPSARGLAGFGSTGL
jgi:dUTP pyrophosphatase